MVQTHNCISTMTLHQKEVSMLHLLAQHSILADGISIHIGDNVWSFSLNFIIYLIIAAIVGFAAEFIVGWRLPFGFIGAIIAALIRYLVDDPGHNPNRNRRCQCVWCSHRESTNRRDTFCSTLASLNLPCMVSPSSLLLLLICENSSCTARSTTEGSHKEMWHVRQGNKRYLF